MTRTSNKHEDRYGLLGALFCFFMSWLDSGWALYWGFAGVVLFVWTAVSMLKRR